MLFEMFVIGTFWFWLLILAEFCFLIFLLEKERYVAAPFSILGMIALVVLCGSGLGDVAKWIVANPWMTLAYAVGYFAVGTLFTALPWIGKWAWFVRNVRDVNREQKRDWLAAWQNNLRRTKESIENIKKKIASGQYSVENVEELETQLAHETEYVVALTACNGAMTAELLPFWKEFEASALCYDWFGRRISIKKPEPEHFKARIIAWIVYWPPVMFWTLLNDPLRHIGRMIYDSVAGVLKGISDSAWKDEDKI